MRSVDATRREKQEQLNRQRNEGHQRLDRFRRSRVPNAQDACKMREWIVQNRARFQGHVYGPIALELSVEDPNHAAVLEKVIPIWALTGARLFRVEEGMVMRGVMVMMTGCFGSHPLIKLCGVGCSDDGCARCGVGSVRDREPQGPRPHVSRDAEAEVRHLADQQRYARVMAVCRSPLRI
jgi:hypothetical protein